MNRRGFVTGAGAVAAAGAAAQTLLRPEPGSSARSHAGGGLRGQRAPAGRDPIGMTQVDQGAPGDALTLGYIPGSAEFLKADSPPLEFGLRSLRALIQARASIGIQRYVPSAHPTIERIDIVVNFALDEPPYAAPFYAWQHLAVPGEYVKTSAPLCFTTGIPHAAGIDVNFRLRSPISATVVGGVLSYPIGGAGLGYGIYALAAPSPATGGAPDWNQITWSGQAGVLARNDGGAIDFDYVTLLLIPAADS